MKRKKKRKGSFETPEEYRAWRAEYDANLQRLRAHVERIKAELAAKGDTRSG